MGESESHPVIVEAVTDSARLRHFIDLPRSIYSDDPHWISPLDFEVKQRVTDKNPFFEHARVCLWVAYRNGRPVGRISAQVDALYLERYPDKSGYFGMIEGVDDAGVFAALLDAAESWLRQQGMERVRGPLNLSMNEEVGLLVDGFDSAPFILMGHNRPWYGHHIEARGYAGAVFNAAKERALDAFLAGEIRFTDMAAVVEEVLDAMTRDNALKCDRMCLEDVIETDHVARIRAAEAAGRIRMDA